MSAPAITLAADYTQGGKSGNWLAIYKLADGRRYPQEEVRVSNKTEARRIAKLRGATPWNF